MNYCCCSNEVLWKELIQLMFNELQNTVHHREAGDKGIHELLHH